MSFRSSVKHVVVKTAIVFVILTVCQTKSIRNKGEAFCDPAHHQYYVRQIQRCKECDRCWPGEEPDLQGADLGMGLYGATKCPKCRSCSEGTYNPDGDISWKCQTCTTCSETGLHENQPCTKTQDTKCSNNVRQVSERIVSSPPGPLESVGQNNKGEDSHSETVTNVIMAISVGGVVALIAYVIYIQRRKLLQKCMGTTITPDTEESNPLNTCTIGVEPDWQGHEQANYTDLENEDDHDEADDRLGSIKDMRNTEKIPLIGFRKRYKSCGDYESTGNRFDKQVNEDKTDGSKRGNPAFQRQLSHPVTNREVKDKEQQLDKRRPNQNCVSFLSKLLAPDKMYKDFSKKMGLPQYKTKLLEEELNQRNLNPEDISYEYTSRTLQSMPEVSYSDIYDALTDLGLDDERTILREKRHKFIR